MLHAVGLKDTTEELLGTTVCNLKNEHCTFDKCGMCPGTDHADALIRNSPVFDNEEADSVQVCQWISGVWCCLETVMLTPEEIRAKLLVMMKDIKVHHFVSKQQAKYLREVKTSLTKKEAIVLMDFSENYSSVEQDAPQSYHWVNVQATPHPVVTYLRAEESTAELSVKSFVVISD